MYHRIKPGKQSVHNQESRWTVRYCQFVHIGQKHPSFVNLNELLVIYHKEGLNLQITLIYAWIYITCDQSRGQTSAGF
jgi:hypothetical protein